MIRLILRYLRHQCLNCGCSLHEVDRRPGAIRYRCEWCKNTYDHED